jgi:hypothetical protein
MEGCCPSLPHFNDAEIFTNCAQHCAMWIANPNQPGAKKCCILNCTLTSADVMTKNETFIADKMAKFYQKTVRPESSNVWFPIIKKVINNCRDIGMKYKELEVEEMTPQCETTNITVALNITRCIRRELFFECKDKPMESENCQLLKGFGTDCLYWPWQCYRKKLFGGIDKVKTATSQN